MQATDLERHDSIAPIEDEWDALADRAGAVPWLRPGWIGAWREAFGRGQLEILAFRREGRLVAIVPLERLRGALLSTTNWHTPEFGILAENPEAACGLLGAILDLRPRRVSLRFLSADSPDLEHYVETVRKAGYLLRRRTIARSPYLEIRGDFAAYLDTLDRKFVRELRRRRRRLEDEGTVAFEIADGSDSPEELLEEGYAVEASGWKAEQGTAITSQPETRTFYDGVARWAAKRGSLRLAFLRLDGQPLAFQFGLEDGGRFYLLKSGYDQAYRRFGPGLLMRYEMLAWAHTAALDSFEFLGDDVPWKLEWTNTVRELLLLEAFAPTASGRIERAAFEHGQPLARRVLTAAARRRR